MQLRLVGAHAAEHILQQTLDEEGRTDHLLTALADGHINRAAGDEIAGDARLRSRLRYVTSSEAAARSLLELGARAIVVKGGHGEEDPALDLLVEPDRAALQLVHPRAPGRRLHGSGCRHASALAALLARGVELSQAARSAGDYVAARLASGAAAGRL